MPPRTQARNQRPDVVKEFEERVISIDRVARVVRGGRRFRFRSTVVIGDGKGRVGVGVGKGSEVMTSITKAVAIAKKNMITVKMRGTTIPHEVQVRFCGAEVMLKPASEGTGVIAGGAVRAVVEAAGIHDLLTKSFGSTNKVNNAYATIMALSQLQPTKASLAGQSAPAIVETITSEVVEIPDAAPAETKPKAKKTDDDKPTDEAKTAVTTTDDKKDEKKPVAKKDPAKKNPAKKAAKPKEDKK